MIALSAEGQLESASVFLADGSLLVPEAYAYASLTAPMTPLCACHTLMQTLSGIVDAHFELDTTLFQSYHADLA